MAKNYIDPEASKLISLSKSNGTGNAVTTFTTSRGIEIVLKPVPPYLVQMATSSMKSPEVPTYEVKLEGGGTEIHKHDEESIKQSSPEEQAIWEKYSDEVKELNTRASDVLLSIILLEGVEVEIPDIDRFTKRMKLMGMDVPTDADERDLFYRKAYVIGCEKDAEQIIQKVLELTRISGVTETLENSFRNPVEPKS